MCTHTRGPWVEQHWSRLTTIKCETESNWTLIHLHSSTSNTYYPSCFTPPFNKPQHKNQKTSSCQQSHASPKGNVAALSSFSCNPWINCCKAVTKYVGIWQHFRRSSLLCAGCPCCPVVLKHAEAAGERAARGPRNTVWSIIASY